MRWEPYDADAIGFEALIALSQPVDASVAANAGEFRVDINADAMYPQGDLAARSEPSPARWLRTSAANADHSRSAGLRTPDTPRFSTCV